MHLTIFIISPFLWTMKHGSGVTVVYQTVRELAKHADVHLIIPADVNATEKLDNATLHLFRLSGWAHFLSFGKSRSLLAHRYPGGRVGRYIVDKFLWFQFVIQATLHASRICRRLRPAIYYGMTVYGAPVAYLLRILHGGLNITRLFGTFLGPITRSRFSAAKGAVMWCRLLPHFTELLSFLLPAAAVIVSDDGTGGEEVARRLRADSVYCWRDGVNYVPSDVDLRSRGKYREALLRKWNIARDCSIGLYIGQLIRWKRVDRLLEAYARINDTNARGIRLLIVGDGPEWEALQQMVTDLGICRSIQFCGAVTHSDLIPYRLGSDFFVCPHDLTCACNSTFEAMASGLPVVATSVGDTHRLIDNGREGILVSPESLDDLAEGILRVSQDAHFRSFAGNNARRRILTQFGGWEERIRREYELLVSMIPVPTSAPATTQRIPFTRH